MRVQAEHCLAHLCNGEFAQEIERLRNGGTLDARGVEISDELLRRILDQLRTGRDRSPRLPETEFAMARFPGRANFERVHFAGDARFENTKFSGYAGFRAAEFHAVACFDNARFERAAGFGRAKFHGAAEFSEAHFDGEFAHFNEARFSGGASFSKASFSCDTGFGGAQFEGGTDFDDAQFSHDASFDGTQFSGYTDEHGAPLEGYASFDRVTFAGDARFDKATFKSGAQFRRAIFQHDAHFPEAECGSHIDFSEANFARAAHFPGVAVDGDARFREASLKDAFVLGPMLVRDTLVLDGASFSGIEIRASADKLLCQRTQFHGPANLRIRWAEVALDGAVFESPSLLGTSEAFDALHEREQDQPAHPLRDRLKAVGEREREWRKEGESSATEEKPRLVSLRGATVGNLVVSDIDLGACLFMRAANLDGLRIEGSPTFLLTPRSKRRKIPWLPAWGRPLWWTRRQTLAEEHRWRFDSMSAEIARLTKTSGSSPALKRVYVAARLRRIQQKRAGWYPDSCRPPAWLPDLEPIDPRRISALYRALRKGREDGKDTPGAGDFYYGEMEMRRQLPREQQAMRGARGAGLAEQEGHGRLDGEPPTASARTAPIGERLILWLYWLVSGYGLRASRALIALAVTVVVFAFFFDWWGFDPDQGFGRALVFSIESTSSLFRVPETKDFVLSAGGEVLQVMLRLLGPLFFGLALLSLRGRVSR